MGYRYPSIVSHMTDVESIFDLYTLTNERITGRNILLTDFFTANMRKLLTPCRDHRIFSHCQPHYLFTYNTNGNYFSSYSKAACNDKIQIDL